jgi:hypothetical protein
MMSISRYDSLFIFEPAFKRWLLLLFSCVCDFVDAVMNEVFKIASKHGRTFAMLTSTVSPKIESVAVRRAVSATPISYDSTNMSYLYFTSPIFMGLFVGAILVFFSFLGSYELLIVQNPDRFASSSDKPLIVPAN